MLEGCHFIKDAPQRPHIALVVVWLVLTDLGGEVVWRANGRLGQLLRVLQHACNPKVAELDQVVAGEEDVLRFEVAVKDLAVVHMLDGEAQLHKPERRG